MTDSVAKEVCSKNVQLTGVNYTFIWARIRYMVKDPHIQHERTAKIYSAYSSSREYQIGSRRDQNLLKKHRTGKYKKLLDGSPHMPLL